MLINTLPYWGVFFNRIYCEFFVACVGALRFKLAAPLACALRDHAAARSRPGRFRCGSGWSPGRPAAPRSPSLRSKLPCSRPPRFFLSRCGLGARPGRQLLRLRADPVRPAAVPGLCPSAPEPVSPVRLPSALLLVTLRRLRDARLPSDSEHKHSGFQPSLVCIPRSSPSALLRTPPRFFLAL